MNILQIKVTETEIGSSCSSECEKRLQFNCLETQVELNVNNTTNVISKGDSGSPEYEALLLYLLFLCINYLFYTFLLVAKSR